MRSKSAGRGQVWLAIARDILLMGIGGLGLIREIFVAETLDMAKAALFLLMIAGSGSLNALWLMRHTTGGISPSDLPSSSPQSPSSRPSS